MQRMYVHVQLPVGCHCAVEQSGLICERAVRAGAIGARFGAILDNFGGRAGFGVFSGYFLSKMFFFFKK